MHDKLGAKDLQGALREGTLVQTDAQGDFPAQVEVGVLLGVLVGDPVVGL